jgi:hypothetical protein
MYYWIYKDDMFIRDAGGAATRLTLTADEAEVVQDVYNKHVEEYLLKESKTRLQKEEALIHEFIR